ncbi:coatomer beta subunit [Entamoeba histolytica HM-3:IMSS]|uniref:Coatomer subunit beta n=9 Tax=Entamoeba histolytica TaxID=5759 RepID=A0A8U0WPB4_ENTH1|eukprot:XP_654513.1 coatomer beta subunit, putative [Entamoeba histolytica HM-1:IMSS]
MDGNCTLLLNNPYRDFRVEDVSKSLSQTDVKSKITALTKIITAELNGDHHPELLMEVIRNAMPCTEHQIKRLVLIYLESIDKMDKGELRPELILAINGLLQDLNHPNEYIRGITLKFLCHVSEKEIIQPLVNAILENMTHKHVYVRKATANAIGHIYQVDPSLVEHAGDILRKALKEEKDSMTRVVIFSVITRYLPEHAIKFLISIAQQITTFSEPFIMVVLKFIRLIYKSTPQFKSKYIEILGCLISSNSLMVKLEVASIFPLITGNAHVVTQSIQTLVDVVCSSSDVNVKIIGIQRIKMICSRYPKVIKGSCISSLLRMLSIPSIRKDVLQLVMTSLAPRNAGEIVTALRKEIGKDDTGFVVEVLVALRKCKEVNEGVEIDDVMFEALTTPELAKEAIEYIEYRLQGEQRENTVARLIDFIEEVSDNKTLRSIIWMICEYCSHYDEVISMFKRLIVELPNKEETFIEKDIEEKETEEEKKDNGIIESKTVVLADGTYGSVIETFDKQTEKNKFFQKVGLRTMIEQMDSLVISSLAIGIAKICSKVTGKEGNCIRAKGIQILLEVIKIEKKNETHNKMSQDCKEIIQNIIFIISGKKTEYNEQMKQIEEIEKNIRKEVEEGAKRKEHKDIHQIDEKIHYEIFNTADEEENEEKESRIEQIKGERKLERLNNIVQLTGYSDPFYIEAIVTVTHFDITLDCLIMNQTPSTLQNITIELIPHGGMTVKTKPSPVTLGPGDFVRVSLGVKVDATTVGVISGYVNYDIADKNVTYNALDANLILNELRIEYLDQMRPCDVDIEVYQKKWMEYEWENKIPVDTECTDLKEYADLLCSIAKLQCITPAIMFCDSIGFLSANFYAKNLFDEDALINLSAEKIGNKISGWVRIRSKTQSLAINLGDRIVANQKRVSPK